VDTWAGTGTLDIDALAGAGVSAVIAKVSDGLRADAAVARDARWASTSRACLDHQTALGGAGMVLAGYGVLEPGPDPAAQARRFLELARDVYTMPGAVLGPPACDFELAARETGSAALHAARVWTDVVAEGLGRRCMLYTMPDFFDELVTLARGLAGAAQADLAALAKLPLWLAHYGVVSPRVPQPWTRAALWQRSGGRTASPHNFATLPWLDAHGAEVDVDVDVFHGTIDDFVGLAWDGASTLPMPVDT
jgi:lysozyme